MKKIFALIFFLNGLGFVSAAQVLIEVGPVQNERDAFSSVIVYGSDGLSRNIPYSKVKGSAFWNNEWMSAEFYDRKNRKIGIFQAKVNLVAQEIHYLDSAKAEKAVPFGILSAVVFLKKDDSLGVISIFRAGINDIMKQTHCKDCYVQELNQGHTKLMKITRRIVRETDSLFGTMKSYLFADDSEYFVQTGDQYNKIRKLEKNEFFAHIPGSSLYSEWIKEKKIKFKTESDYLVFLEYYNKTYRKD